jgi:hypothetical protein
MSEPIAYKLFNQRKDGSLGPLFIGKRQRIDLGVWLEYQDIPTKGYAHRPGWHSGVLPIAEHLSEHNRVWAEVQIKDYYTFERPKYQGSYWLISKWIKVIRVLTPVEVETIRLHHKQNDV